MLENDPLFLNAILQTLVQALAQSYLHIYPWVLGVMVAVFGIALTLGLGVASLTSWHPVVLVLMGAVVFRLMVLYSIGSIFLTISDGLLKSIIWVGLQMGTGELSVQDFTEPGWVLVLGLRLALNIYDVAGSWGGDWILDPLNMALHMAAMVATFLLYLIIALGSFWGQVEYNILLLWAFVMWPLMPAVYVAFIANTLVAELLWSIVRLGMLATIMSLVTTVGVELGLPGDGDLHPAAALAMIGGIATLMYVVWRLMRMFGGGLPGSGLFTIGLLTWRSMRT